MKTKIALFMCFFVMLLASCSAADNTVSKPVESETEVKPATVEQFFKISANPDYTYNFKVLTRSGAALISEENYSIKPDAELISDSILKLWAGEGISTHWVRYCDVDAKIVSDVYYGVRGEYESNVVYGEFRDGQHYIIVKNIFDGEKFSREYLLDDASVDADPMVEIIENNGTYSLSVTYLAGLNKESRNVVFEVK